jgi:hypothetical protein
MVHSLPVSRRSSSPPELLAKFPKECVAARTLDSSRDSLNYGQTFGNIEAH